MKRKNKPVEGLTAAELGRKVGVTVRAVRYYTAEGLLPPPVLRGPATRYGRGHLLRLAAIRALQQRGMTLARIRAQLARYDSAAIQDEAAELLPELARPAPEVISTAPKSQALPIAPKPEAASTTAPLNDTWYRLAVMPGLELHVHATASADVQALALSLVERASERLLPPT